MDNTYMVTVEGHGRHQHSDAQRDREGHHRPKVVVAPITDGTLLERYAGDDGVLQKSEMIDAINDHIFGVGMTSSVRSDMIKVITSTSSAAKSGDAVPEMICCFSSRRWGRILRRAAGSQQE